MKKGDIKLESRASSVYYGKEKKKCLKNISDEAGQCIVAEAGKPSLEQANGSLPVAPCAPAGEVSYAVG